MMRAHIRGLRGIVGIGVGRGVPTVSVDLVAGYIAEGAAVRDGSAGPFEERHKVGGMVICW